MFGSLNNVTLREKARKKRNAIKRASRACVAVCTCEREQGRRLVETERCRARHAPETKERGTSERVRGASALIACSAVLVRQSVVGFLTLQRVVCLPKKESEPLRPLNSIGPPRQRGCHSEPELSCRDERYPILPPRVRQRSIYDCETEPCPFVSTTRGGRAPLLRPASISQPASPFCSPAEHMSCISRLGPSLTCRLPASERARGAAPRSRWRR